MKKIIAIALMFVSSSVLARPEYTCVITTEQATTAVDTSYGNKQYSMQRGLDVYSTEFEEGFTYSILVDPKNPEKSNLVVFKRKMPSMMADANCKLKTGK